MTVQRQRVGDRRSRRAVLTGLARLGLSAAGLALLDGCAQPFSDRRPAVARVGLLTAYPHDSPLLARYYEAFATGMRELGWIEGQNVAFFPRYMDDGPLPELAADLVRLQVDVIVTLGAGDAAQAARSATSTLPVVFPGIADPVADGLVVSLAHPGGNMTGPMQSMLSDQNDQKHIELLESAVPGLARLAMLFNPTPTSAERIVSELEQSAKKASIQTLRIGVRSLDDLGSAFAQARAWPAQVLFVLSNALVINPNYALIADLALRSRLPSITVVRAYAEAGGLMTYGPNIFAIFARAAYYVDRILRGANPSDLPVERPTVFEFVVNVKTAQALGISFPPDVAGQVTEWIQ